MNIYTYAAAKNLYFSQTHKSNSKPFCFFFVFCFSYFWSSQTCTNFSKILEKDTLLFFCPPSDLISGPRPSLGPNSTKNKNVFFGLGPVGPSWAQIFTDFPQNSAKKSKTKRYFDNLANFLKIFGPFVVFLKCFKSWKVAAMSVEVLTPHRQSASSQGIKCISKIILTKKINQIVYK